MITVKQFQALKKGSVSVNAEKSDKRIPEAFKSASTEQKSEIIKLSGLSKYGFYKASASPKSVLALACVLNISPYYLTGENDYTDCNDDVLKEFYKKCVGGIQKKTSKSRVESAKEKPAKTVKSVKAKPKPVEKKISAKSLEVKSEKKAVLAVNSAKALKIDDESLVSLLRALSIRAKFGGEAEMTYNAVVSLLIK